MPTTITAAYIAATIDAAPAWAKIGLTMPVQRLREDAVMEFARYRHNALHDAPMRVDPRQMALPTFVTDRLISSNRLMAGTNMRNSSP